MLALAAHVEQFVDRGYPAWSIREVHDSASHRFAESESTHSMATGTTHHAARVVSRTQTTPVGRELPGGWLTTQMIAEGRLTRVYLALHVDAPRQTAPAYAVKMVRADLTDRTAAVALLRREATVARRARHPHLVSVLAEHTSEAPYFLVMPLLEGESLDRHLVRRGVLPIGLVLWYLRQVCEALVTMHQSGFIHGDIKPANIHVSRQGHATLLDLGFARQPSGRSATGELALLGTPNYLAPELISRGGEADIRSDFFSLGVTLFELLTGQLPYDLHERGERSTESAMGTARRMRRLNPKVSRGVAELAAHLLAHDPLRRPQEPNELLRHLVALEIEHLADRV